MKMFSFGRLLGNPFYSDTVLKSVNPIENTKRFFSLTYLVQ